MITVWQCCFICSGLDHSTRRLCGVLLWGGVRLPSQLVHECHQSCYCANSGKPQTVPDQRHFHFSLRSLWGFICASSHCRCTLSTLRQCPSPAVLPLSSMVSQCSILTTALMSSSRSIATWWSEPVAATDCTHALHFCKPEQMRKEGRQKRSDQTRQDWLAGHQGALDTDQALRWGSVFMTSSWAGCNHYHSPIRIGHKQRLNKGYYFCFPLIVTKKKGFVQFLHKLKQNSYCEKPNVKSNQRSYHVQHIPAFWDKNINYVPVC